MIIYHCRSLSVCTNLCSTLPLNRGSHKVLDSIIPTLPNIPHDVLNIGRISKFCLICSFFCNISTYKRILIVSHLWRKTIKCKTRLHTRPYEGCISAKEGQGSQRTREKEGIKIRITVANPILVNIHSWEDACRTVLISTYNSRIYSPAL